MIDPDEVVAVILAAGLSRRFGSADKLTADYAGRPLILHAAQCALALPFRRILAVCRTGSEAIPLLEAAGIGVLPNEAPERGMGTSLAIGAGAARSLHAGACLVLLGDMPHVEEAHLHRLLAAYDGQHDVVASLCDGQPMPPALFGARHFPTLCALDGDQGARDLLRTATTVAAPSASLHDIDSPADLAQPVAG